VSSNQTDAKPLALWLRFVAAEPPPNESVAGDEQPRGRVLLSRTLRWVVFLSGLLIALGISVAVWQYFSKPTHLTVAVGPSGFDDTALISAFSRTLATSKVPLRLSIVLTSGPVEALEKLTKGEAQLAVVRGDGAASDRVRAVAILHNDPVVVVTADKVEAFSDLKGKTIGVIGPPGANDPLLAALRRHYRMTVETKGLAPVAADVSAAMRQKTVNALLFVVPTTRGANVGASWAAVREASRKKLSFVPIDDAEAIAAATPAYEAGEIAGGQFGGSPMLPEESVTTIMVATYLVADRNISNDAITALTRSLFEERQRIAADASVANLVKAASTDKDAIIPVHPGAKVYYDGEETTLMERYGDWLFYGPMLLGGLGSVLLAAMRFLGLREEASGLSLLARVRDVIASIKQAGSVAELEAIRAHLDASVARVASEAARGNVDERQAAVAALAINYIDHVMAERRAALMHESRAGAPSASQPSGEKVGQVDAKVSG
jgi:TRAP transporter TAXI family solute receptor